MAGDQEAERLCPVSMLSNQREHRDWSIRTEEFFILLFAPVRGGMGPSFQADYLRDIVPRSKANRDGLVGMQRGAL